MGTSPENTGSFLSFRREVFEISQNSGAFQQHSTPCNSISNLHFLGKNPPGPGMPAISPARFRAPPLGFGPAPLEELSRSAALGSERTREGSSKAYPREAAIRCHAPKNCYGRWSMMNSEIPQEKSMWGFFMISYENGLVSRIFYGICPMMFTVGWAL